MNGYDKNNLFREPILFRNQGEGRFSPAVRETSIAASKAFEFPFSTCVECGKKIPAGSMQRCELSPGGFCSWRVPTAVSEFIALIPNSENKPKYSLTLQLVLLAVVFLLMATGAALVFMGGGR